MTTPSTKLEVAAHWLAEARLTLIVHKEHELAAQLARVRHDCLRAADAAKDAAQKEAAT